MDTRIDLEAEIVKLLRDLQGGKIDKEALQLQLDCLSLLVKVRVAEKRAVDDPETVKANKMQLMLANARRKVGGA